MGVSHATNQNKQWCSACLSIHPVRTQLPSEVSAEHHVTKPNNLPGLLLPPGAGFANETTSTPQQARSQNWVLMQGHSLLSAHTKAQNEKQTIPPAHVSAWADSYGPADLWRRCHTGFKAKWPPLFAQVGVTLSLQKLYACSKHGRPNRGMYPLYR